MVPIDIVAPSPFCSCCMCVSPLFRRKSAAPLRRWQSQQTASFGATGSVPPVLAAQPGEAADEFRVTACESVFVELDIVFEPGAEVTAELQTPAVNLELMTRDAGGRPRRVRHDLF